MNALLLEAAERAARYLARVKDRSVAPDDAALARLTAFRTSLPDGPSDPQRILSMLDDYGSPATVVMNGPRYFGFVNGAALPAALAANWLATAWDQNAALAVMSPVAATLEEVTLKWVADLFGLPSSCGGALVTGATMANFTALAAARHAVLMNAGWDVEADGLAGAPPVKIIVGEQAHVSLLKAVALLGLGRKRVLIAPSDSQGRIQVASLPSVDAQTIVCIQAGNVNSGAFDPAGEICRIAHEAGSWVHVDGAFGLWASAAPGRAHLARGFEQSDSWATDAHKWLNVPYDSGLALVRDPRHLRASMSVAAPYLTPGDQRDPMDYTPESSRRARGVELWAALASLGRAGLADLIERTCGYATSFAEGLSRTGYSVLNDVVLNQVVVSFGDDELTRRVIAGVQRDGVCWCGGTTWQGRAAMRISVVSWKTTQDDIDRSLDAILRVASANRRT